MNFDFMKFDFIRSWIVTDYFKGDAWNSLRRACQPSVANPEMSMIHVDGSGTGDGPSPLLQGPVFFLPFVETASMADPALFFTGAQTPSGRSGGERASRLPPPKGLYKFIGPRGSKPPA
jgi:hypothetical protein